MNIAELIDATKGDVRATEDIFVALRTKQYRIEDLERALERLVYAVENADLTEDSLIKRAYDNARAALAKVHAR